jgi:superfamily II DNA/RNA helicase
MKQNKNHMQNLFFSATFSKQIRAVAENFLRDDYYFVTSGNEYTTNASIVQEFHHVEEKDKLWRLHDILQDVSGNVLGNFLLKISLQRNKKRM